MAHTLTLAMQRFCDREAMNTAKSFISEFEHYVEVNKIDVDQSLAVICCQYYLQKTFNLFDTMYSAKIASSNSTEQDVHKAILIGKDGSINNKNITDIIKEFKQNALNFIRKDRQSFTPSLPVEVMRQGNVQFLTKDGVHQITKNTTNKLILAKSNHHYFLEIYCSNKVNDLRLYIMIALYLSSFPGNESTPLFDL